MDIKGKRIMKNIPDNVGIILHLYLDKSFFLEILFAGDFY